MSTAVLTTSTAPDPPPLTESLRVAIGPWIAARVLVAIAIAVAIRVEEQRNGVTLGFINDGLLSWDAAYYRDIANGGYNAVEAAGLRFFPLLPVLGRIAGFGNGAVGVVLVANAAALGFGVAFHRLVTIESGDPGVATRAVWLASLFPSAAVLVFGYAESLLMLAAVLVFLGVRSQRWWIAAAAGYCAGLARPTGVVLALPAAIEAWRTRAQSRSARDVVARLAAVAGPPFGLATFLAWAGITYGDVMKPLRVFSSSDLRGGWVDPLSRLARGFGDLLSGDRVGSGLHVVWAVVFLALLVVMARRLPSSYTAWSVVTVVLALSSDNLDSFERYCLVVFPFAWVVALLARERWQAAVVVAGSASLMFVYTVLAVLGTSVP